MSLRKHGWLIALALALAAALTWYFASPWYTLRDMREAARANDVDRMSAHIDYPALRDDLKSELMARMTAEMDKDKTGMGAIGLAFGSAMMGPLVNGFVSPAGLRAAFLAQKELPQAKRPASGGVFNISSDQTRIARHGLDSFDVITGDGSNGKLVFKRHGLGWQLSGVDLPPAN